MSSQASSAALLGWPLEWFLLVEWILLASWCLGLAVGIVIHRVAHWLPQEMATQWDADARAVLAESGIVAPARPVAFAGGGEAPTGAGRGGCAWVMLLSATVFSLCAWVAPSLQAALAWMVCAAALLTLSLIDARHLFLPDVITQPLLWTGLAAHAAQLLPGGLEAAVWGAIAGYLSLALLGWAWVYVRGTEGVGRGDAKLLAALGAWFGIAALPLLLLAACASGLVFALGRSLYRRGPGHCALPSPAGGAPSDGGPSDEGLAFGPHLAVGAALAFWFQPVGLQISFLKPVLDHLAFR